MIWSRLACLNQITSNNYVHLLRWLYSNHRITIKIIFKKTQLQYQLFQSQFILKILNLLRNRCFNYRVLHNSLCHLLQHLDVDASVLLSQHLQQLALIALTHLKHYKLLTKVMSNNNSNLIISLRVNFKRPKPDQVSGFSRIGFCFS